MNDLNGSVCSQSSTSNSPNVVSITKWKWQRKKINQNSSVNIILELFLINQESD